ncbi:hypothetical protein EDC04DRAFT_365673 [Pisolithus marmoratus]|nr:hypothetical protein EDC04DRAFT_365673 [Pisolithus marmoratus]
MAIKISGLRPTNTVYFALYLQAYVLLNLLAVSTSTMDSCRSPAIILNSRGREGRRRTAIGSWLMSQGKVEENQASLHKSPSKPTSQALSQPTRVLASNGPRDQGGRRVNVYEQLNPRSTRQSTIENPNIVRDTYRHIEALKGHI